MKAADIFENEAVDIWNLDYGARFQTYAITGRPGSGTIRIVSKEEQVIIASWQEMTAAEAQARKAKLAFVDDKNEQLDLDRDHENPGQGQFRKAI